MTNLSKAVIDPMLIADPAGPRITYYDDATGERIELSAATLANWAAKTGNLLRDELGAGPGTRVALLLPAHWQTAAVLFGIWWVGAEAVPPAHVGDGADIALCTRDRLAEADAAVAGGSNKEVAVLSLDPFGKPAPDLPVGVTDYATAVRLHGDQITPEHHAGPSLAGLLPTLVLDEARRATDIGGSDRVLSTRSWETATDVIGNLLSVMVARASLVQVRHADPGAMQRRRAAEKITRVLQ